MDNGTWREDTLQEYEYPDVFILPGTSSETKSPSTLEEEKEGETD